MELIDKAAVEAEIEKKLQDLIVCKKDAFYAEERVPLRAKINMCKEFLSLLDTLEVKKAGLERELDKEWNKCEPIDEGMGLEIASIEYEQFDNIAKHFYELGIAVSNKAQKGEEA